jgi:hypothetical protein
MVISSLNLSGLPSNGSLREKQPMPKEYRGWLFSLFDPLPSCVTVERYNHEKHRKDPTRK